MLVVISKIKSIKINKIYMFLFLFLLVLCFMFPYTNDDWTWGTSMGLNLFFSGFDNYNGRWVGNILALILTRSILLRTITMAFVLTGIIVLISKITNQKNTTIPLIAIFLILGMKSSIWAQGFVWTSGFVNYTVSIFLILIYFYLNRKLFSQEEVKFSFKSLFPLLLLGFSVSLIMENITIYNLLLAIFVIVFTYIKQKKIYASQISYFIGSILGTILMFSNSAYASILNNSDPYRSVANNGLMENAINNYFGIISTHLLFQNIILITFISIILLLIAKKVKKHNKFQKIICLFIFFYPLYSILNTIFPSWQILLNYTKYFNGLITFLYAICLFIFPFLFIKDKNKKNRMIFVIVSIGIITGLLLFVNPVGCRNFFPTYILFVLYAAMAYDELKMKKNIEQEVIKVFKLMIIMLAVYLLSIYVYIFKHDIERTNYIKEAVKNKEKTIYFETLPYEEYVWLSYPIFDKIEYEVKYFYNIPFDTKVVSVPFGSPMVKK